MATIRAAGYSERFEDTGKVTVTITGTPKKISGIRIEGEDITEITEAGIRATVEYYIENPPYVIPVYIPKPDTMLAAYAAMLWLFTEHGTGEIDVEGNIGTLPQVRGPKVVY